MSSGGRSSARPVTPRFSHPRGEGEGGRLHGQGSALRSLRRHEPLRGILRIGAWLGRTIRPGPLERLLRPEALAARLSRSLTLHERTCIVAPGREGLLRTVAILTRAEPLALRRIGLLRTLSVLARLVAFATRLVALGFPGIGLARRALAILRPLPGLVALGLAGIGLARRAVTFLSGFSALGLPLVTATF